MQRTIIKIFHGTPDFIESQVQQWLDAYLEPCVYHFADDGRFMYDLTPGPLHDGIQTMSLTARVNAESYAEVQARYEEVPV